MVFCILAANFLLLSGCDEEPVSGQVVAVVNGEEITVPELNEEARSRGIVIGNDRGVLDAVLKDVVERKLLAQAAQARRLDRTPEYLLAQLRSNELLLAEKLVAALDAQRPDPSERELAEFIRSRPYAFDRRAHVFVDRVRTPAGLTPELARALAETRSLDRLQSLLVSKGVGAERRVEVWDTATLSPEMAERLMRGTESGTRLEFPDQVIVARVIHAIPHPTPAGERLRFARELLRSERSRRDLQDMLRLAKSHATIRYQPRFAPTAVTSGAKAARR